MRVRIGDHTSHAGDDGDFGWGVVVSFTKKSKGRSQKSRPAASTGGDDSNPCILVEVLLRCAPLPEGDIEKQPTKTRTGIAGPGTLVTAGVARPYRGTAAMGGHMRVVPVLLPLLDGCRYVMQLG